MDKYYRIGTDEKGYEYIACKICGMKSYHSEDIKHKYCGNCHEFLEMKHLQDTLVKEFKVDKVCEFINNLLLKIRKR